MDSQSGFRIYPISETLGLKVAARRYQFEVEVLVRAAWQGIPIVEAPISAPHTDQHCPGFLTLGPLSTFCVILKHSAA